MDMEYVYQNALRLLDGAYMDEAIPVYIWSYIHVGVKLTGIAVYFLTAMRF